MKEELKYKYSGLTDECIYTAIRSSGPGGQNVNKVSSKVELRFNIDKSKILSDEEKAIILNRIRKKINKDGELIITSQTGRSQIQNKIRVTEKFLLLIKKALITAKKRVPTSPTRTSMQKRLENKKIQAEKKKLRSSPEME